MGWTDNPVADFNRHCDEQEAWLQSRPICDYCEGHIQEDYYYEIDDDCVCKRCLNKHFKKYVD